MVQKVSDMEGFHVKDGEGCREFLSEVLTHSTKIFVCGIFCVSGKV